MKSKFSVGVVGMGFVGGAVFRGFNLYAEVKGYDIDDRKATHTLEETLDSDFIFIAVPTPMETVEGGKGDTSLVTDAVSLVVNHAPRKDSVIIIKSTIPIGTTRRLQEDFDEAGYNMAILHSPEFLTERAANVDFIMPARNIIGGTNEEAMNKLQELYEHRFPGIPCLKMGPEEAELVKYGANCFFATKIMFLNEINLLAEKLDMDWEKVRNGILADGRIAHSHSCVPGHDGDKGFGGKCFPKDINALIGVMEEQGIDPLQLKATWEQNKKIRKDWDWATIKGAVSEK
jgi:UDPglucose 6-dehydrogenase